MRHLRAILIGVLALLMLAGAGLLSGCGGKRRHPSFGDRDPHPIRVDRRDRFRGGPPPGDRHGGYHDVWRHR